MPKWRLKFPLRLVWGCRIVLEPPVAEGKTFHRGPGGVDRSPTPSRDTVCVTIFLSPTFTMMTLACIIDTLRIANRVAGREIYRWILASATPMTLSSVGVPMSTEVYLGEPDNSDIVIVCGGLDGYAHNDLQLQSSLRRVYNRGALIIGISTGIWPLARAGLLDGRSCAVHWDEIPSFSEHFPEVYISRDIFVTDGRIITCSGGSATLDLMLDVIDNQSGSIFAGKVADLLIHSKRRPANERQRRIDFHENNDADIIKKTVGIMENNVEQVMTIDAICKEIGQSRRKVERKFLNSFGITPKRYYLDLRLKTACKLLIETDISIIGVGLMCGYQSGSQFSKEFRRKNQISPLSYRKKYSMIHW